MTRAAMGVLRLAVPFVLVADAAVLVTLVVFAPQRLSWPLLSVAAVVGVAGWWYASRRERELESRAMVDT